MASKVSAAKSAAGRPLSVTDVEFAMVKLRESFVAAQPIVSTAVAALFKKKFGLATSGAGPDWFVQLKSCAGKKMQPFMTESGPWDIYTVFDILRSKFTDFVLPGLDLSEADKDDDRFKLSCLIEDVLVTRNWSAHEKLSVQEMKRGMQSLVLSLHMLQCNVAPVQSVCDVIEACIGDVERCQCFDHSSKLSIGSLSRLLFIRNCLRLCHVMGESADVVKAIDKMAKRKDHQTELQKYVVLQCRHDLCHGKSSGESLSVLVALCAVSSLLRSLGPSAARAAASDSCDADILQILARMHLCEECELLQAISIAHHTVLRACPYAALLADDMARMRHLLWRTVPLRCPSLCPIIISDKALRARIMQMLEVVKLVPSAATAGESDAVAWLVARPPQLSLLLRGFKCSVPATEADVRNMFASLYAQAKASAVFCSSQIALPQNGWSLLQLMLPEMGTSFHDAPCDCMIKFGDAMSIFGSDAAAPTAHLHKILKLCKDFMLCTQKCHDLSNLEIFDDTVESVLAHVAILGCSLLQSRVDALPAAAVEVKSTSERGLSTRATIQEDRNFIARYAELKKVGSAVEAVFKSVVPAPRTVLLLRGHSGLGKSAVMKQGLRLKQNQYHAAHCCKGVQISSVLRGRGATAVQEDLVRWGRELGSLIGVGFAAPPETVLPLLKAFLEKARYVVLIDDADESGIEEALKHLPPSRLRCAFLVTSQILRQPQLEQFIANSSSVGTFRGTVEVFELQPFTSDECMHLMRVICPPSSFPLLFGFEMELCSVFELLVHLPVAVRLFADWMQQQYHDAISAAQAALPSETVFDFSSSGPAVVQKLLISWNATKEHVVMAPNAMHSRGLQGTVKLAIHALHSKPYATACSQLLALLALCPPAQIPWSLFDGGGLEHTALLMQGQHVIVKGRSLAYVSITGESCYIPKLKMSAVAMSDEVIEGTKVAVQLFDGKATNVKCSDLQFEGDAIAEVMERRWAFKLKALSEARRCTGRVMRQHDNGSLSIFFQGPHSGCHVQLHGLACKPEYNGYFGYVCGAYESASQRWPVRVTLRSNEVKVLSMKAENLICTRNVIVRNNTGHLCAVPAFASGFLADRPGAEVLRFRREDVDRVQPDGVLQDVTDALGMVASALRSSGLIDVNEASRTFGMHQLLQLAVREELGDTHDDAMRALIEARCGCMGDEMNMDHRINGVMREILVAAANIVGKHGQEAPSTAWACGMRVRLLQLARNVFGETSLETSAFYQALDSDLSTLGVVNGQPAAVEFRAMHWWRCVFKGREHSHRVTSEIEGAIASSPNLATDWDCRVALGFVEGMLGLNLIEREMYDLSIELFERALSSKMATLGEFHSSSAVIMMNMGLAYIKKGQFDRAMELYDRALRIQMTTLGQMHADTASSMNNMVQVLGAKGQHNRTITLLERALCILIATLGEMHERTAGILNNIGVEYNRMRQFDTAIKKLERALHIQMTMLGEMNASTATTIACLGASYAWKGQLDLSIAHAERALRICHVVLVPDHPQTRYTEQGLASAKALAAQTREGRGQR